MSDGSIECQWRSIRVVEVSVPYEFREEFEVDDGYRFYRDRVSLLMQSHSYGRKLSNDQNSALAIALDKYLDQVSSRPAVGSTPLAACAPLTECDFQEASTSDPFYKFVGDATLEYLKRGSIQFGTAHYYRTSPDIRIQDVREGAGHFHLCFLNDQLNVSLISGNNCAIFCGTSQIDGPDETIMQNQFGRHRIRIDSIPDFMKRASKCIGAYRSRVYDVVYRDVQSYTAQLDGIGRFLEITGRGPYLTSTAMRKLNREFFGVFYEYGLMPGLYAKPFRYAHERERRLIFETKTDLRKPIIIEDKKLLSFITFLDD